MVCNNKKTIQMNQQLSVTKLIYYQIGFAHKLAKPRHSLLKCLYQTKKVTVMYMCVRVSIWFLFIRFFDWMLELFQQWGIFWLFIILMFKT
jgi:hypothetical protein